jgi:hypothetical protein
MKIGNNSGFNITNFQTNVNNQQAQKQRCLANAMGFTPPPPSAWGRDYNSDGNLPTGLSKEHLEWRTNKQDPMFRANQFLYGIEGREGFEEPLGIQVLTQLLHGKGIELPENISFRIDVNKYGGVTISGLDNDSLTRTIEKAMSYDSQIIVSVLATFMESARILEGNPSSTSNGLSVEQQRLIGIQSDLTNYGGSLFVLSLDEDGQIQGLPQELYDKIYGDRSAWLSGMDDAQAKRKNWNIDRIKNDVIHFLKNGTEHILAPDISLTFDNGRIIADNGGKLNISI